MATPEQSAFFALADHIARRCHRGERFVASLQGEASDFARLNRGRVRQAGHVAQRHLSLQLCDAGRHATVTLSLTGHPSEDAARVDGALDALRAQLAALPPDPHLLLSDEAAGIIDASAPEAPLPAASEMVEILLAEAAGEDLVGILARGPVFAGVATSAGQRSWFRRDTWHLDYSLYAERDKAVKVSQGGTRWRSGAVAARLLLARRDLDLLRRPSVRISPGAYRAHLTPAALGEVFDLLSWGGFGAEQLATRRSPLSRLQVGEAALSPSLHVSEHTAAGVAPPFSASGFLRPPRVPLITAGRLSGSLVSPRSAQEHGGAPNGAEEDEQPEALDVAAGELPTADVMARLGTGVFMANAWYLNYSDQTQGRITGMTRFATLWVEGGEPVGPLDVMRFDVSLYHALGAGLEALTAERELLLCPDTYGRRSTRSTHVPGALVDAMPFTL